MRHRSRDEHGAQHHIYRLVKDWALRMRQRSRDEHGAQHHIYRLVKDWALRRRQRSRDHHAKWRGVRAHVNFCRADSFNDTNDEQLTTKCVDESNRTKNA